jgi:hypothetical protein
LGSDSRGDAGSDGAATLSAGAAFVADFGPKTHVVNAAATTMPTAVMRKRVVVDIAAGGVSLGSFIVSMGC